MFSVPAAAVIMVALWLFEKGRTAAKEYPAEKAIALDAERMKPLLANCRDCGESIPKQDLSLQEQGDLVKKFETEHAGHWVKVSYKL